MELRGCIFDLDGVIIDTAKYHYLAWKRLAKELGFKFTEEQNEALKGVSRMTSLDILLSIGGVTKNSTEKEELADRKNGWYIEYISKMTPAEILPGSIELIEKLRSEEILTAIGSASKNARTIIERIGIEPLFDVIIDGFEVTYAKPHPEIFLKCAAALRLKPETCIVFEDAIAGVEAALAGGMKCIGIGNAKVLSKADFVSPGLFAITVGKLKNL